MKYCCRSEVTIKVCFQNLSDDCDSPLILKESFHYAQITKSGVFLEKIHKGENINGEGAKRPSGGEGPRCGAFENLR